MKLLITILLILPTCLKAQTKLHGTLLTKYLVNKADKESFDTARFANQPVELLDKTTNRRYKTYTDTDGKFYFDDIQKGLYHLIVDDPILKQKKSVFVDVQYEGKKNTLKPIIIDRVNQTVKVRKD